MGAGVNGVKSDTRSMNERHPAEHAQDRYLKSMGCGPSDTLHHNNRSYPKAGKPVMLPSAKAIAALIDVCEPKECRTFARKCGEQTGTADEQGWKLLQQVFSFLFKPTNTVEPFEPFAVGDGKRSMIPSDLTDEQLDELRATLDEIADPEYQARIGDVLWLRRKDAKTARVAVRAYLETGKLLEDPMRWLQSMQRYERALRLARQIEPKGDLPKLVLSHLESRVIHYDGGDPLFFSYKALKLLAEFRYGDFSILAAIAGKAANQAFVNGDFRRARSYYEVQAEHLKLGKKNDEAEAARIASARTHVDEAESREAKGEYIAAHTFWGDAISAFRDRASLRKEIPELQKRYSASGEKLRDEMEEINSDPIDISEFVEGSRAAVRELPWPDAFYKLVSFVPLIDPAKLRASTESELADHPLQATISADMYDASGRKIGVRPPAFTENKDQYERAIAGFMEQRASIQRSLVVCAHIVPAMKQILDDNEISRNSFPVVLDDSALIPDDRRDWFYQAFEAGFRSDFSTALHILIPQIENGLRHLLERRGVKPVTVDNEGVEEVWGLERILSHSLTLELLGASFVFELKSLLVERVGPNLRNLFAHGALSPESFRSEISIYLFWLIMRLAAYSTSGMRAFIERETTSKTSENSC